LLSILYVIMFLSVNGQKFNLKHMQDSLAIVNDTVKIKLFIRISNIFNQTNTDSAFYYVKAAINLADKIQEPKFQAYSYRGLGLKYKLTGETKKSEKSFFKALEYAVKSKDNYIIASIYNNLGVLYTDMSNYDKALKYLMKSLQLNKKMNEKMAVSTAYNNIGLVFYYDGNYDEALNYYKKALKIKKQLNDSSGIALGYNNIGIIYYFKDKIDTTFKYFKKALKIYEKLGQKRNSALALSNIGELYADIGLYNNSINYYLEANKIYEDLKDTFNITSVQKLLAQVYIEGKDINKAKEHLDIAYNFAKKAGYKNDLIDIYNTYSDYYTKKRDYKKALDYMEKYSSLKDSVFNIEKSKSMQELQTKYETKQKNQEIALLNKEKKLSAEKLEKQRLINFSLIGGIFLFLIIIFLAVKQNIERKRKNDLLRVKNAEILQQKEEIIAQRDEIESQRNYVTKQRDLIKEQKDAITDSIDYAKKIQTAVLPTNNIFDKIFKDYFILFKPKDIVSGDFYWANKFNDCIVIAVADCTGHGVPGGFMSMLGITYLTEIIREKEVKRPNQVLNQLREYIVTALKQKGVEGEQKDGMDFSICFINTKTKELEYAGANNPIYIIDEENINVDETNKIKVFKTIDNLTLYEIKPDKMPIGHYPKMNDFTSVKVKLTNTSKVYMFTDGMPDQFGGEKGKKYNYKRFKNILLENSNKQINEQYKIINNSLTEWQGSTPQIDDITVIGFSV